MKIQYNGRQYGSLAELPEEGRRLFERLTRHLADRDGNGVPDLLEGDSADTEITLSDERQIVINRHSYTDLAEVPADQQQMLRQMRGLFDRIREADPAGVSQSAELSPMSKLPASTSTTFSNTRTVKRSLGIAPPLFDSGQPSNRGWERASDLLWRFFVGFHVGRRIVYVLLLAILWVIFWMLDRHFTSLIFFDP